MLIYIPNFHLFVWFLARPLFVSSLLSWHLIPGLSVGLRSSCFFFFYYFLLNKLPELAENEMAKEYCRWLWAIFILFRRQTKWEMLKSELPWWEVGGGGVSFWQRVRCFAQLIMSKWVFRSHLAAAKRGLNLSAIVGKCQASATHTYYTHTHGHTCGGVCHILAHPSSDFRNFLNFRAAQIGI